jgi:ABC-type Fe3+ transport system permease subunit
MNNGADGPASPQVVAMAASSRDSPPGPLRISAKSVIIVGAVLLMLFPSVLAVVTSIANGNTYGAWTVLRLPAFTGALGRSFVESGTVAVLSLLLGWPCGALAGLQSARLPRAWGALLPLPLALPPFVWAIGLSYLRPLLPYARQAWLDGFSGAVLALTTQVLPITLLLTYVAVRQLSASAVDAALLHGGRSLVLRMALRHALPTAVAAALLGGLLVFGDSGCDQIMGYHGFSSEILIAFSARNDMALAAVKATIAVLMLLPIGILVAVLLARHLNIADFARPASRRVTTVRIVPASVWRLLALGLPCVFVLPPLYGLLRPLLGGAGAGRHFGEAVAILSESGATSLRYGATAAVVALLLGAVLARPFANQRRGSAWLLVFAVIALTIPSPLHSLGVVSLGSVAPPAWDWLLRSEWTVGWTLGLRLAALTAVALFASWARVPRAAHEAALLHAVPRLRYTFAVVVPNIAPILWSVLIVTALLALSDVGSTMLLQPPGGASFPSHLFAVMDNSSEARVASLTLVYLLAVCTLLLAAHAVPALWRLGVRCVFRDYNVASATTS